MSIRRRKPRPAGRKRVRAVRKRVASVSAMIRAVSLLLASRRAWLAAVVVLHLVLAVLSGASATGARAKAAVLVALNLAVFGVRLEPRRARRSPPRLRQGPR